MADLEKQLADLEIDAKATDYPSQRVAPVASSAAVTGAAQPVGGKQIQQAITGPSTAGGLRSLPMYFYGILAAVPLVVIAVLYFMKPKLVYRKKKFVIQDFVKLTVLASIGLWVLIAVIMYFGGYISTR